MLGSGLAGPTAFCQAGLDRIHDVMAGYVDRGEIPGIVTLVSRKGELRVGYFDSHGWGFGMSMVTHRSGSPFSVGTYGWDGGLGTTWRYDPIEDLTCILMTQRAWTSPAPPKVCLDFWAAAYESIGV